MYRLLYTAQKDLLRIYRIRRVFLISHTGFFLCRLMCLCCTRARNALFLSASLCAILQCMYTSSKSPFVFTSLSEFSPNVVPVSFCADLCTICCTPRKRTYCLFTALDEFSTRDVPVAYKYTVINALFVKKTLRYETEAFFFLIGKINLLF